MKRSHVFVSALLATLLLGVPAQSQAFFGLFGGGFSFGFGGGWGGWGGPGWWSPGWGGYPGYWGAPGYWGGPGYWNHWYRPYRFWRRPYLWRRYRFWGDPFYGVGLPYWQWPPVAAPAPKTPETPSAHEK